MIIYQEYPPCPQLAPYLACLWTCHVLPGAASVTHRVLPDNCIDILWQNSAAPAQVAGMMSSAIHVHIAQPVRTIAVRFKPGAAAHFFALPLHQLADLHPALDALWPPGVAAQFDDALWARPLDEHQALHVVQSLLQSLLLRRLQASPPPAHAGLAQAAVAAIERSGGAIRIASLAQSLGVSRQHLANQFRARVGLGAKQFARVCRFRTACARIGATPARALDWARLAQELGYYDQPHLIHEFRELSGSTPESFARA